MSNTSEKYAEYLESAHWKDFRRRYRADPSNPQSCLVCGSRQFQLHHCTYRNLSKESFDDVMPLCRTHHVQVHAWLHKIGLPLSASIRAVEAIRGGDVVTAEDIERFERREKRNLPNRPRKKKKKHRRHQGAAKSDAPRPPSPKKEKPLKWGRLMAMLDRARRKLPDGHPMKKSKPWKRKAAKNLPKNEKFALILRHIDAIELAAKGGWVRHEVAVEEAVAEQIESLEEVHPAMELWSADLDFPWRIRFAGHCGKTASGVWRSTWAFIVTDDEGNPYASEKGVAFGETENVTVANWRAVHEAIARVPQTAAGLLIEGNADLVVKLLSGRNVAKEPKMVRWLGASLDRLAVLSVPWMSRYIAAFHNAEARSMARKK